MTRAVRRMDENIVKVRQVHALELTITYGMNRGRILEIDKLGEHDMFSNFHFLKNIDEEKMKCSIDVMKCFFSQSQNRQVSRKLLYWKQQYHKSLSDTEEKI